MTNDDHPNVHHPNQLIMNSALKLQAARSESSKYRQYYELKAQLIMWL